MTRTSAAFMANSSAASCWRLLPRSNFECSATASSFSPSLIRGIRGFFNTRRAAASEEESGAEQAREEAAGEVTRMQTMFPSCARNFVLSRAHHEFYQLCTHGVVFCVKCQIS